MKKTSRIMLTIGVVLSYVAMAALFLCAIAFFVCSLPPVINGIKEAVIEGVKNGSVHTSASSAEEAGEIVMVVWLGYFITLTVVCLIWGILCLVAAIQGNKARKLDQKKNYIVAIVLGAISAMYLLIPAGILGVIAKNKEAKNEVIDETK